MNKVLVLAAVGEVATGAALLATPALVGRLLLGAELSGVSVVVGRVAGIALVALGIACWPGSPLSGMLTYTVAVTVYLLCLGIRGEWVGSLLWPAVAVHAVIAILLGRAWLRGQGKVETTGAARSSY
jgi:hypothetical protein